MTKTATDTFRVSDPEGLHVRNCGLLLRRLEEQAPRAEVRLYWLGSNGESSEVSMGLVQLRATGVLNLVSLGVRQGDLLRVRATGPDAIAAVDVARRVLETAMEPDDVGDFREFLYQIGEFDDDHEAPEVY